MIANLTQHPATPEQLASGVKDFTGAELVQLKALLTFTTLPNAYEVHRRARGIAAIAAHVPCTAVMIGGAGYLMPALETELQLLGISALHAFTERHAVETVGADGQVTKTAIFKHVGFVDTAQFA